MSECSFWRDPHCTNYIYSYIHICINMCTFNVFFINICIYTHIYISCLSATEGNRMRQNFSLWHFMVYWFLLKFPDPGPISHGCSSSEHKNKLSVCTSHYEVCQIKNQFSSLCLHKRLQSLIYRIITVASKILRNLLI